MPKFGMGKLPRKQLVKGSLCRLAIGAGLQGSRSAPARG
jgi:hypothetical protein